jgi:hypothetical protein
VRLCLPFHHTIIRPLIDAAVPYPTYPINRMSESPVPIESADILTSQSARAPVTELEGEAGVTNVNHGLDVDAMARQPAVTFGEVTTIEVT